MATIGTLTADLTLESASFISNLNKSANAMQNSARQMEAQTKTMQGGLDRVGGAVSTLKTGLASLGVGFSVAAVAGFVKGTFQAADALKSASDAAGVSAEQLQEWRHAAEQSGSSAGQMDDAIVQLNKRLGDFVIDGTGPAAKAFKDLGIAAKIQSGELSGTAEVMDAVIAQLAAIEDPARRASQAADLFGKSAGPDLAGLLNEGVAGINQLRDSTTVLSNEQVARADEIGDAWEKMTSQVTVHLQKFTLNLVDAFVNLEENHRRVTERLAALFDEMGASVLASVQSMVAGVEEWLGSRLTAAFDSVMAPIQATIDAFRSMYTTVVGQSIIPDMITEVQGWMERLEGPAMLDPAKRAAGLTAKAFGELPAHIRQGLQESIGEIEGWTTTLAQGPEQAARVAEIVEANDAALREQERFAEQSADLMLEPYRNFISSAQSATSGFFESILSGGVDTFGDLFEQAKQLAIKFVADTAALLVFNPQMLFGAGGGGSFASSLAGTFAGGAAPVNPPAGGTTTGPGGLLSVAGPLAWCLVKLLLGASL